MGQLRDRMDGDLRLRGFSEVTRTEYLRCAKQFVAYLRVSPQSLGAEDVRRYLLHLVEDLGFSPSNRKIHIPPSSSSTPSPSIAPTSSLCATTMAALRNAYSQSRTAEIWARRDDHSSLTEIAGEYWPAGETGEVHAAFDR